MSILKVKEVAYVLNISETTVIRLINKGMLKGYQIGRQYRIPEINLERYLRLVNLGEDE